jgi:hypothetical protein
MGLGSLLITHQKRSGSSSSIRPGSIFLDTNGNPINAHGGGFLFHDNTYYWYGEIKIGKTYLPKENANWGGSRVDFTGISCYSSHDLIHWQYRGNVLPAVKDKSHDLYYATGVAERPKVIYNSLTNKFVMWLHIDSLDYKKARSGVATSDSPHGSFTYIQSIRPNGQMARDLTLFVDYKYDDDESHPTAYLIASSENNAVTHIHELTSNYTSFTGNWKRIFENRYMEAPTIFVRRNRSDEKRYYYFVGSGCSGWLPNAARSAVSTSGSIWGPWTELGNPCRGNDANTTFHSQSTYVLPLNNGDNDDDDDDVRFIFAADRWNEKNLSDSRYVWLPLTFEADEDGGGSPIIHWHDEWQISSK